MQTGDRSIPPTGAARGKARRLMPLETLTYEHLRQKCLCNLLGRIVDDLYAPDMIKSAAWALRYLENVLPVHVSDEAEDLVPRLLAHGAGDEAVGEACRALLSEHRSDGVLVARVKADLERLSRGLPLARPLDFIMNALALEEQLRRHVAWENAEFLPLARRSLAFEDLTSLGRTMARRHGLC
jgi:hemerythrin-like domain-containing protein